MTNTIIIAILIYLVCGFIVAYRIEINLSCRHHTHLRVQDYILIMLLWPYIVLLAYAQKLGEYVKKGSKP